MAKPETSSAGVIGGAVGGGLGAVSGIVVIVLILIKRRHLKLKCKGNAMLYNNSHVCFFHYKCYYNSFPDPYLNISKVYSTAK